MKTISPRLPFVVPVDEEHACMMDYARGSEGQDKIAKAQSEIDAGRGLEADDAYFENLKARRGQRRALKPE